MNTDSRNIKERQLICIPPLNTSLYQKLTPKRFDTLYLHEEDNNTKNNENPKSHYRYKLQIYDRPLQQQTQLKSITHPIVIFFIPAGRENEYLFSTSTGLDSIAKSANCARLVAVSFSRHHSYPGGESVVQEELKVIVQMIGQNGCFMYLTTKDREWYISQQQQQQRQRNNDRGGFSIPFMALDGIGKRHVVFEGESSNTGKYIVEEVKVEQRIVRRLYFLKNENVIQTEVFLKEYPNEHVTTTSTTDADATIDVLKLAFEYHSQLAVGVLSLNNDSFFTTTNNTQIISDKNQNHSINGMVIGLGGGALVNFFSAICPMLHMTVIELDQDVVGIAKSHFGFLQEKSQQDQVNVIIGDGLMVSATSATDNTKDDDDGTSTSSTNPDEKTKDISSKLIEFTPHSFQFIAIDVDSKDTSVGMSCPPTSFISTDYLTQLSKLLRNGRNDDDDSGAGVLAINVSARDPEMLELVKRNVQQVFTSIYISNTNDDDSDDNKDNGDGDSQHGLNVVIFCTNRKAKTTSLPSHEELSTGLKNLSISSNDTSIGASPSSSSSQDIDQAIDELREYLDSIQPLDQVTTTSKAQQTTTGDKGKKVGSSSAANKGKGKKSGKNNKKKKGKKR